MNVTTLCLGALYLRKSNGLRNQQMFEDGPFSHFLDASYGSIYPALTRLTAEGKVHLRGRASIAVISSTIRSRSFASSHSSCGILINGERIYGILNLSKAFKLAIGCQALRDHCSRCRRKFQCLAIATALEARRYKAGAE